MASSPVIFALTAALVVSASISIGFYAVVQRKRALALCLALCTLGLGFSASAQNPIIITFDAPGAGTIPGQVPLPQGTFPYGINDTGAIGGNFQDVNNVLHGFFRAPDGAIVAFDAPGAGTGAFQGTQGFVINSEGAIAGKTIDANFAQHGMVRARDGTITTFDAPGASMGPYQGTFAVNINREGVIAGSYVDASNVFHVFLRAPDGAIATFDVPGAGTGSFQGTYVCAVDCLNSNGAIVGGFTDASNVNHGFLRTPEGAITTFDALGAGAGAGQGTFGGGINPAGIIVGSYLDANNVNHGFLLSRNLAFTTFDVPGAGTGPFQGTLVSTATINSEGEITGNYLDANNVSHGFLRARHGAITTFDVPAAGTTSGLGTTPVDNNAANAITGWYADASGLYHGFVRTGRRCREDRHENCQED